MGLSSGGRNYGDGEGGGVIWKGADERGIKNNKWTYAGNKSNACQL